ncbi:MAG: hypothetical protein ABFD49_06910 [Armatimonadota bacterium]
MAGNKIMLIWCALALTVMVVTVGCSTSDTTKQGFLEKRGIKSASELDFVVVKMTEGGGTYRITDKTTLDRIYDLINGAERTSTMSKYMRSDMVTLVRKNGSTQSFAFSLWNPNLTWDYSAKAFVKFVKDEIVGKKKYIDKSQLPSYSINQIARIEGASVRVPFSTEKAAGIKKHINSIASAYTPGTQYLRPVEWSAFASNFTKQHPGVEATLVKPIEMKTLVGDVEMESPHGSSALRLTSVKVDKILIYLQDGQLIWLALHSTTNGGGWFSVGNYGVSYLSGNEPLAVYQEMIGR